MKKISFVDVRPHLLAVLVFLVVTLVFFSPVFFDNKALDQQDIQQHIGSSKALRDYRDATGEEGLWASSMFSGMPAYLVNLQWSDGVVVTMKKVLTLFLPHPVRNIFAAFICYYIMLLAFRVRPYLAIAGALAFGLSSYMIIGLAVGHNARIGAIAFVPLVVAGIELGFSGRRMLGFAVTAAGMAFHLRENHLQITYYMALIVGIYGLVQLIYAVRNKTIKDFFTSVGVLIPAVIIAAATFFGQFWAITEYTRYSMRGQDELVKPGSKENSTGLTRDYAFAWTYGIYEPFTLLVPEFYGGSSTKSFLENQKSATYRALMNAGDSQAANQLAALTGGYWGPQDGTIGPYYGGAIVVFLFVLGIIFAEKKYTWWLVTVGALGVMLSWGREFSSFNYFVFDYLPGYNKFRSFSFALMMILFAMPLLGMLGLEKFLTIGLNKDTKRKLLIAFGATGGVCLLMILFAGMGSFYKDDGTQLPAWFIRALQEDRRGLLRSDAIRSLAFILSVFILLYLDVPKKMVVAFAAFLILAVTFDLSIVDKRYFTKDNYQRKRAVAFADATPADQQILKDKGYFRVYSLQEPWSMGAKTSYFHHSLSGYHGAKIRRYQDLYDSCISRETQELVKDAQSGQLDFKKYGVLDMLNTKYIVYGPERENIIPNDAANGPAWFVKEIKVVNSPTEELKATGEVDTKAVAVVDGSKFKTNPMDAFDSTASINLIDQKPNWLKYESQSLTDGFAVFSEIYYPKGWRATIDGQEASILRADYVLRALTIPAGKHTIEFTFEPKPYTVGNKITLASGWALLLMVLGSIGWSLRKEQQ
jgi:hypothetical protein